MHRQNARQPDGTLGWFDRDKAEPFDDDTEWDGSNHVSQATGSPHSHEQLWHTRGGQWVLNAWSRWQGTTETWEFINSEDAREWLLAQNQDAAVERLIGPIEDEVPRPGRPEIGNRHTVPLGDLEEPLRAYAKEHNLSFNGAIRAAVRGFLRNRKEQAE